jgi:hypothetical protein
VPLTDLRAFSSLSVSFMSIPPTKLILIELPHEAETGANRLWVKPEQLDRSYSNKLSGCSAGFLAVNP